MIIFIDDNSTIRSKGQHAEGDKLALARPRNQEAQLHSRSTAQPSSASVHSNCALKLHTRIYKTHQPTHTTRTHAHRYDTINTPDWWVGRTTAPVWAF